jgi:hypothetical protein
MTTVTCTRGPFIARPLTSSDLPNWLTVAQAETNQPIAIVPPKDGQPNYGDAARFATSDVMLDTLIAIQEQLMTSKETVDLEEINDMISRCFEKINAEADV